MKTIFGGAAASPELAEIVEGLLDLQRQAFTGVLLSPPPCAMVVKVIKC
jgi:hypothetical protein